MNNNLLSWRTKLSSPKNYAKIPYGPGPITYSNWTIEERSSVHGFLISKARQVSKRFKFFQFNDLYNAGYIGYLEGIRYHTWAIHCSGISAVKKRIYGAILQEVEKIYGRVIYPSGESKRQAAFNTIPVNQALTQEEIDDYLAHTYGSRKGFTRS
jgi:hypothetical protein